MFKVDITTSGGPEIEKSFKFMKVYFGDMTYVLEKIRDDVYATQKKVFESGGAYEGRKTWEPSKSGDRLFPEDSPLRKSLTNRADSNAVSKITKNTLQIGSKVRTPDGQRNLANLVNKGWTTPEVTKRAESKTVSWRGPDGGVRITKKRSTRVPARKLITISQAQKKRWLQFLKEFATTRFKMKRGTIK
jgi:hypothetical protein